MIQHLTCRCRRVLHVREGRAACPTCGLKFLVIVECRPGFRSLDAAC